MPGWTNVSGCAIQRDLIYLAQHYDDFGTDHKFTRMTFYDGQSSAAPWVCHDRKWTVNCVCVWRNWPYGNRVYVALGEDGDIEITGPRNQPEIVEKISA